MKKALIRNRRFQKGQAFVEYVILIAVVALAAIFVLANFSDRLGDMVTGITNTLGGEVEVRLDNFGSTTLVSRKADPAKENPIVLKGSLDGPGFLRAAAINPAVSATPFGLGKGNECASVGYEAGKLRPGFPRPA